MEETKKEVAPVISVDPAKENDQQVEVVWTYKDGKLVRLEYDGVEQPLPPEFKEETKSNPDA